MSKISETLRDRKRPTLSLEFFPTSGPSNVIDELAKLEPDFVSITCGALGSQTPTLELAVAQNKKQKFPVMPHIASASMTIEQQIELIDKYTEGGIENFLALRGDLTAKQIKNGYARHARDLAELIEEGNPDASIGVAANPEKHPESEDIESDRRHLAAKLAVADFAITQFFFNPGVYADLVEDLDSRGCNKPVIPGIMLFTSEAGLRRIADLNNTDIPNSLKKELETAKTPADIGKLAVATAGELAEELLAQGAPGVHIYTMNRSKPTLELLSGLTNSLGRSTT